MPVRHRIDRDGQTCRLRACLLRPSTPSARPQRQRRIRFRFGSEFGSEYDSEYGYGIRERQQLNPLQIRKLGEPKTLYRAELGHDEETVVRLTATELRQPKLMIFSVLGLESCPWFSVVARRRLRDTTLTASTTPPAAVKGSARIIERLEKKKTNKTKRFVSWLGSRDGEASPFGDALWCCPWVLTFFYTALQRLTESAQHTACSDLRTESARSLAKYVVSARLPPHGDSGLGRRSP